MVAVSIDNEKNANRILTGTISEMLRTERQKREASEIPPSGRRSLCRSNDAFTRFELLKLDCTSG